MKTISIVLLTVISLTAFSQTPIDEMQKSNVAYLEEQEKDGFEFRSQIITEFDKEHASQNVNIKLNASYNYQLVAMGDSNVSSLDLLVKPSSTNITQSSNLKNIERSKIYQLKPDKSGRYKITIQVSEFSEEGKGFVSFMVLRK